MPRSKSKTQFLNVDLDLEVAEGLDELVAGLKDHAFILNPGNSMEASFELLQQPSTPSEAIASFHKAFQTLSVKQKKIWRKCEKRVLNVGIKCGAAPAQKTFVLDGKTLSLVSLMSAELAITVYRC